MYSVYAYYLKRFVAVYRRRIHVIISVDFILLDSALLFSVYTLKLILEELHIIGILISQNVRNDLALKTATKLLETK